MALTDKLTSIAAAIREKSGTTELLTLDAMPTAIANLPTGGGEDGVPNPLVYTDDCEFAFGNNKYNWLIENYGDRIQTKNISVAAYLFNDSDELETIPFDINCDTTKDVSINYMFSGDDKLKSIGKITCRWYSGRGMLQNCYNLRYLPEFNVTGWDNVYTSQAFGGMFVNCYSLREIPTDLITNMGSTRLSASTNSLVYSSFNNLASLDELVGVPVISPTLTSNAFDKYWVFKNCYRLKRLTFDTKPDGTPRTAQWKNQTIDLSQYCGWAGSSTAHKEILNYNSGITAEDEDNGRDTNPNYWTRNFGNSRFGHDAAVELINSLPDTEDYLVSQGASNNIIKFYTNAGSNVGDSVNSLTEEEIAVAVAKGWSITYGT